MPHYDFFQNKECEFFPCHKGMDQEKFSCLFCYCPLYCLGDKCGGAFKYTENGVKDCSGCLIPHRRENYGRIMEKYPECDVDVHYGGQPIYYYYIALE